MANLDPVSREAESGVIRMRIGEDKTCEFSVEFGNDRAWVEIRDCESKVLSSLREELN